MGGGQEEHQQLVSLATGLARSPGPLLCYPLVESRSLGLALVGGLAGHAATPLVVARGR